MADITRKKNVAGEVTAYLVRWRENGKQRYKQFKSEAEAQAFKKDRDADRRGAKMREETKKRYERGEMSVDEAVFQGFSQQALDEEWSVTVYARRIIEADSDLREGTKYTYRRALTRYFQDTDLGKADIRYITPQQITAWWAGIKGGRQDAHRLLSKVINRAIMVGDREDNPLLRTPEVRKPRQRVEVDFDPLTSTQIEQLADAATKATKSYVGDMTRERDRLMILTMGYAGLRAGECGGLRAQDLLKTPDAKCQLRIRQQVIRDEPGVPPHIAPLKTSASRRTISVACSLWDELMAFVAKYGTADNGLIFRGPNGEPRDHSLTNNMVRRAGERIGMDVHSHLLRHSAVSLLIHAGANPRSIQAFAGHSSVTMTLDVYGHLFDQSGTELADIMEGLREQHRNGGN